MIPCGHGWHWGAGCDSMKPENVKCPDCDGPMVARTSQYGKFWGCKNYPNCKGTRDGMGMSNKDREIDDITMQSDRLYSWDKKREI